MDLLKNLSEVNNNKAARVIFKTHKEQIKTALQSGFSRMHIFLTLSRDPNFDLSYTTFTRWINREWSSEDLAQTRPAPPTYDFSEKIKFS